MRATKKLFLLILCLCAVLPLGGCGAGKSYEKQLFSMDTAMTLTAYGKNAEKGLASAAGIITSLDAMLDPENEDSTVYAINHAKGQPTVVRGQIVEMLSAASAVYERSEGALDLTIYPLVKAWGFIDGDYKVPTEEEISALLGSIDYSGVKVTSFADTGDYLVAVPTGTELTFAAVARGCASDYAIAARRDAGVESAIVSLGGSVQTLGTKPDGSNWNVAVQDPNDTGSYVGVLNVGEAAVVTSGGYQRYFEQDGVRYHHILDPATGCPAQSGLLSATVVCKDGMTADALSTALCVLGEKKAVEYWRTYGGFDMVLVTDDGRVVVTSGLYDSFQPYGDTYTCEYVNK